MKMEQGDFMFVVGWGVSMHYLTGTPHKSFEAKYELGKALLASLKERRDMQKAGAKPKVYIVKVVEVIE